MRKITLKLTTLLLMSLIAINSFGQSPSIKFSGTDNAIEWGGTDGVLRDSENHTWEMWVKGNASNVHGVLYTEGSSASVFRAQYRLKVAASGKLEIVFRDYDGAYLLGAGPGSEVVSATTVFDGTWHHIAVVETTTGGVTSTVLYVDGVADATDFGSYTRPTVWENSSGNGGNINRAVIGQVARLAGRIDNTAHPSNKFTWYDGEIDEFRAWKRALGAVEIAGNACVPANTTNLYRHVKFDEGSGTAFADEVGGADGDLLGATNGATYTTNSQCISLSVNEETLSKNASIYPNPASSLLSIDVAGDVKLNAVQVIDLTGKVVYSADYTKTIDVSSFAKGMYLLKLNSSGASIAKKIIVD